MKKSTCLRWHSKFYGQESCELKGGPGMPVIALTKGKINTVDQLITTDLHLTTRQLVQILYFIRHFAHNFTQLFKYFTCLCTLDTMSVNAKTKSVEVCEYWSKYVCVEGDEWWKTIIIADKSWVYTIGHIVTRPLIRSQG